MHYSPGIFFLWSVIPPAIHSSQKSESHVVLSNRQSKHMSIIHNLRSTVLESELLEDLSFMCPSD